jgi:hypothetical protein
MVILYMSQDKILLSSKYVLGFLRKERLTTIENVELGCEIMTTSALETNLESHSYVQFPYILFVSLLTSRPILKLYYI